MKKKSKFEDIAIKTIQSEKVKKIGKNMNRASVNYETLSSSLKYMLLEAQNIRRKKRDRKNM